MITRYHVTLSITSGHVTMPRHHSHNGKALTIILLIMELILHPTQLAKAIYIKPLIMIQADNPKSKYLTVRARQHSAP